MKEEREDDMMDSAPHDAGGCGRLARESEQSVLVDVDWLPDEVLDDDDRVVRSWPYRNGLGLVSSDIM